MNELSPDGQWRWDGIQWVPNPPPNALMKDAAGAVVATPHQQVFGEGSAESSQQPAFAPAQALPPALSTGGSGPSTGGSGGKGLLVSALVIGVVVWLVRLAALIDYRFGSLHLSFLYNTAPLALLMLIIWFALGLAIGGAAKRRGSLGFAILVLVLVAGSASDWTVQFAYQAVGVPYD